MVEEILESGSRDSSTDEPEGRRVARRTTLIAGAAFMAGGLAWAGGEPVWDRVKPDPTPVIPDAAEGKVTLEQVRSAARGKEVGLFTAVPAGHGDGAGLPVCMVLHGASATTANFREFGLPRFLSAIVQDGTGNTPFVLAGADGGTIRWSRNGADDPLKMLREELPVWMAERGFGSVQTAWGWSMGGFGVLNYANTKPGTVRAAAAFSPAVTENDAVMHGAPDLSSTATGIWCGTEDALLPVVQTLVSRLSSPPNLVNFSPGGHTRAYWDSHTLEAFRFLASYMG